MTLPRKFPNDVTSPMPTQMPGPECPHECGIDGNHEICKCALCGLTKPINESWCYQTAAEKGK